MTPFASPPAQDRESNQISSPPRKQKRKLENATFLPPKRLSTYLPPLPSLTSPTSRESNDCFRLSPMWKESQYAPSAGEEDILAEIGLNQPEPTRPSTLLLSPRSPQAARDEWYDISLLGDTPRQFLEGEWTPMAAWLSHYDMYARLYGSINADFDEVVDVVGSEAEKRYKPEEKEKEGDDSPTHLTMGKLKQSVASQRPALGVENSIDDLKSATPKNQEHCVTRRVFGYWKVNKSPLTLISLDWTDEGLTGFEISETDELS